MTTRGIRKTIPKTVLLLGKRKNGPQSKQLPEDEGRGNEWLKDDMNFTRSDAADGWIAAAIGNFLFLHCNLLPHPHARRMNEPLGFCLHLTY